MENNNIKTESWFKQMFSVEESVKTKNKLLSFSLMWMGIAVAIIFLVTWAAMPNNFLWPIVKSISGFGNIGLIIANSALMIALFFVVKNKKISTIFIAALYLVFTFVEGIVLAVIFKVANVRNLSDLVPLFIFPGAFFALIGLLGFFNIINFTKLMPFAIFAAIGLLILALIGVFVFSRTLNILYTVLGFAVFSIWIGFDIQMLVRQGEFIDYSSKDELIRFSIIGGLHLFLDFVNLIMLMLRLTNW